MSTNNSIQRYRGIGLMSGTSLDGIDLAFCEYSENQGQWSFELLLGETVQYDQTWYARLRCLDTQNAEAYAKTDVYLGHHFGGVLKAFIEKNELKPQFVASHGQTIFHQPKRNFTAQIGDGETIATYLKCPLVTNFRSKDVAMGGQGAPLVPFGEQFLFPKETIFLNLGGIANISSGALAYDVCVCNMALNWMARKMELAEGYDADGNLARSGRRHPALYKDLENLPYFRQKPPKTLGTEWFTAEMLPLITDFDIAPEDIFSTLTYHIASRICEAIEQLPNAPKNIIVTGGGSHNLFLMELLQGEFSLMGIQITAVSNAVVDYKEAIIFGFLGLNTLLGRPNVLSSATGARTNVCGGSIHLPTKGWGKALI